MFWGLSESLDLCQEYLNALKTIKETEIIKQSFKEQEIKDEELEIIQKKESKTEDPGNQYQDVAKGDKRVEETIENVTKTAENVELISLNEKIENLLVLKGESAGNDLEDMIENNDGVQRKEGGKEAENNLEDMIENNDGMQRQAGGKEEGENELAQEEKVNLPVIEQAVDDTIDNQEGADMPEKGAGDFLRSDDNTEKAIPPKVLHILLFGSADPRHVIHTMAKLHKHHCEDGGQPFVHFHIVEGCLEIYARYIVLLGIAMEHPQFYSLLSKTHLFMDIYGNSLLRPSSHQYLAGKAKTLLKIITDNDFKDKVAPILDLENLKYLERDGIEMSFYFWYPKQEHNFDVKLYWENRNRKLLGTRYDYRNGAFDWDLSMTLKSRQAKQICSQEYRYWRETGIAFTYPEYEQCLPNKTLAAGLIRNGMKYRSRGYVGDIQTGPFCAFGLKTEDKKMMNSVHGENDYRSTEVTERNLLELMFELQTRTPYQHNAKMFRKLGPVRLQMCKRLTTPQVANTDVEVFDLPWINYNNVKVHFLSMDEIANMQKPESRYTNFFDIVFVGQNYFTFIKERFVDVLKPNALLLLETKLLTVFKTETVSEFEATLKNYAKNAQLQPVINYNVLNTKNTILKYKKIQ